MPCRGYLAPPSPPRDGDIAFATFATFARCFLLGVVRYIDTGHKGRFMPGVSTIINTSSTAPAGPCAVVVCVAVSFDRVSHCRFSLGGLTIVGVCMRATMMQVLFFQHTVDELDKPAGKCHAAPNAALAVEGGRSKAPEMDATLASQLGRRLSLLQ